MLTQTWLFYRFEFFDSTSLACRIEPSSAKASKLAKIASPHCDSEGTEAVGTVAGVINVVVVVALFSNSGSGVELWTLAVFTKLAFIFGFKTSVILALASASKSFRAQVRAPFDSAQFPRFVETETKLTPDGIRLVNVTLLAVDGPALLTSRV